MIKQEIEITGMTCGHCEGKVVKELLQVAGISQATANSGTGKASITLEREVASELIERAVELAGYKVVTG